MEKKEEKRREEKRREAKRKGEKHRASSKSPYNIRIPFLPSFLPPYERQLSQSLSTTKRKKDLERNDECELNLLTENQIKKTYLQTEETTAFHKENRYLPTLSHQNKSYSIRDDQISQPSPVKSIHTSEQASRWRLDPEHTSMARYFR